MSKLLVRQPCKRLLAPYQPVPQSSSVNGSGASKEECATKLTQVPFRSPQMQEPVARCELKRRPQRKQIFRKCEFDIVATMSTTLLIAASQYERG
ncbi:hypothetical protein Y032_0107g3807 [Ancylostoma ceylanicum]|uniref:Uncharacterized protein n=1 Tax=Ancylostoma ceylanicum TaxID=53326 RepID=A0A016TFH7_9BILA|nr:hypothetical protein Y032_0107g3807 [Ancylostoma ceylanicum]